MTAAASVATSLVNGRTVITTLHSAPPLTLRETAPGTVHLVSTAAGPIGGDDFSLALDVAPGTSLEIASVAATLVLPGPGVSRTLITATVGSGACLRYVPEPTVLAAGATHHMAVRLSLADDACVTWREELVLGRHGEAGGLCHTHLDATYRGRPLLRQSLEVGGPRSPAVYGTSRCLGTTLLTRICPDGALAEGVAVMPLASPGTLVSALADDAVELRRRLEWGEAQVLPAARHERHDPEPHDGQRTRQSGEPPVADHRLDR